MKNNSKIPLFLLLVITAMSNTSCKNNPINKEEENKIEYSDLYQVKKNKTDELIDGNLYKASYGYIENSIQGYNQFYYVDGKGSDLVFSKNRWCYEDSYIDNGNMCSKNNNFVSYKFECPKDGRVKISGNPKLINEGNVIVDIYLNEMILDSKEVKTTEGIYHEEIIDVKKGDFIYFKMNNDGLIYWNPSIEYNPANEELLHFSGDGYLGDVHPYYDESNNKLYMYYLSTGLETIDKHQQFTSLLYTSDNLVNYQKVNINRDTLNPPDQELFYVLNVYKDKDGKYRSCFSNNSYVGSSISDDLITWRQGSTPYTDTHGNLKYTYRVDMDKECHLMRDPYIYYDKDNETYYCLVNSHYSNQGANGTKYLVLYKGNKEGIYSSEGIELCEFTGRGDPECCQIMKIKNRYYLFYSVYGTGSYGNVGRFAYRVSDEGKLPEEVDWNNKEEYLLDGNDLHAPQILEIHDKYYLYGWINYDAYRNVWGGYLNLPHEVIVNDDGTLSERYDPHLQTLLNYGEVFEVSNSNIENNTFSNDYNGTFIGKGEASIHKELSRNYITLNISDLKENSYSGIKVGLNDLFIGIVDNEGEIELVITRNIDNTNGYDNSIKINKSNNYSLKISIENQFVEVSVNDDFMLTSNTLLSQSYKMKIVSSGESKISDLKINKLANLNNIFD